MKTNRLKQLFLMSALGLAVNGYADAPVLAQIKPQEFYVGTWTASAPDGLGTLKSDFP